MRPVFWFVNTLAKTGTGILCRIDAPDLDKVPRKGPLIVYSNHSGEIEIPLLYSHLQPRPLTGVVKVETGEGWFLRWLFKLWGGIPVRRGEADVEAIHKSLEVLEKGYILAIAPEGTRNKTGKLVRAHPGMVTLALHSGAPLIPVAHWGGETFLTNLKQMKRTDFHIRVGELFKINSVAGSVQREVRQQIVDEMMYRLAALLPADYRGAYANLGNASVKYLSNLPG